MEGTFGRDGRNTGVSKTHITVRNKSKVKKSKEQPQPLTDRRLSCSCWSLLSSIPHPTLSSQEPLGSWDVGTVGRVEVFLFCMFFLF